MTNPIWPQSRYTRQLFAGLLLAVCNAILLPTDTSAREETVGEQFRKVMAQIDAECRKEKVGPYLDPKDPQYNDKKRYTHCDILKLKPYDPLATEEGRFAHSINLPPPHDKSKDVYKPGMTGEEYFKALCEAEAGEWVFKTVKNVDGVYQAREHIAAPASYRDLVFFSRETGEMDVKEPQDYMVQPYFGRYTYLEVKLHGDHAKKERWPYMRFFRDSSMSASRIFQTVKDGRFVSIPYMVNGEGVSDLKSRYGYTWRGIRRQNDWENGIHGSELVVFEIGTLDVLAYRRRFAQYLPDETQRD